MNTNTPELTWILLYARDPIVSGEFYSWLLQRPVENDPPNFASIAVGDGAMLGLWSKTAAKPPVEVAGGGNELMFKVADRNELTTRHAQCEERGVGIALSPTEMPFGLMNTITPGPINTPISGKMGLSAEQLAGFAKMIGSVALGRIGEPDEIANAALYFASDDSRFTTGTELRVDGGITLSN